MRADVSADAAHLGSVGDGINDSADKFWKEGEVGDEEMNEGGEEAKNRRENGMGDLLQVTHRHSQC